MDIRKYKSKGQTDSAFIANTYIKYTQRIYAQQTLGRGTVTDQYDTHKLSKKVFKIPKHNDDIVLFHCALFRTEGVV